MTSKIELRTFVYIDILQPQVASFNATVSQGYLPRERQASLYVEVSPGIAINRITDIAIKTAEVEPGFLIVERAYGMLELHSFNQSATRAAGNAILNYLNLKEEDRLKPRILTSEIITGIEDYQTMLINRMRHGNFILKNEAFYIMEIEPAGYAAFAANEAEKAAKINVLEVIAFGAFGRVYLGGPEEEIRSCAKIAINSIESVSGREIKK